MRRLLLAAVTALFVSGPGTTSEAATDNEIARAVAEVIVEEFPDLTLDVVGRALRKTWASIQFIMYHEIAHMLIHEYQLPVLGWEEDAADTLAVAMLVGNETDENYETLYAAIQDWAINRGDPATLTDAHFYDEHSFNLQRAYHATCLLVGRDRDRYGPIADIMQMPDDRREKCVYISERALDGWRAVLKPHLLPRDAPRTGGAFALNYVQPEPGMTYLLGQMLMEMKFLEKVEALIAGNFDLPRDLQIATAPCGTVNAFYRRDPPAIVMCYEMVFAKFSQFTNYEMGLAAREEADRTDATKPPETETGAAQSRFGGAVDQSGRSITVTSEGEWSGRDASGNELRMPSTLTTKGLDNARRCPGRGTWPNCFSD